jgi:hypothetical protein
MRKDFSRDKEDILKAKEDILKAKEGGWEQGV